MDIRWVVQLLNREKYPAIEMIKNIDRNVVVEYYVLFIRCEVRRDLGLKLMMRIDGVQNYKGNMPYVVPYVWHDGESKLLKVYF